MKQNIFGAILFSLIVGTAVFIANFYVQISPSFTNIDQTIYQTESFCNPIESKTVIEKYRKLEIKEAIYDTNTKVLKAVFFNPNFEDLPKCGDISLDLVNEVRGLNDSINLYPSNFSYNPYDKTLTISTITEQKIKLNSNLILIIKPNDGKVTQTASNRPIAHEVLVKH